MITPRFTLTQDPACVQVHIQVPHLRFQAAKLEMAVTGDVFVFLLPPYYLRLHMPGELVDDERATARYDSGSETIVVTLPKAQEGQVFEDLDLTSKLLTNPAAPAAGVLIEEIGGSAINADSLPEDFSWEIPQTEAPANLTLAAAYGFNDAYSGIIAVSAANGNDINELPDPEQGRLDDRIITRLVSENVKFDPEYYAADHAARVLDMDDDKEYKEILAWKSPLAAYYTQWKRGDGEVVPPCTFTPAETELMMNLPHKLYLVDEPARVLGAVVSVLFGYSFDLRENTGDHTVESAWTVGKLVPQFSHLDSKVVSGNETLLLRAIVMTLYRRSVCYPYHRSYALSARVWEDVYYTLRGGKRVVVKALLAARELFRFHDVYYVYAKVWMDDLVAYVVSSVSENDIRRLSHDVRGAVGTVKKADVVFEKAGEVDEDAAGAEADGLYAVSLLDIEQEVEAAG